MAFSVWCWSTPCKAQSLENRDEGAGGGGESRLPVQFERAPYSRHTPNLRSVCNSLVQEASTRVRVPCVPSSVCSAALFWVSVGGGCWAGPPGGGRALVPTEATV